MSQNTNITEKQLFLNIGGMQCSFCVKTINRALRQVKGVDEVGVSLAHEEVFVRYQPSMTNEIIIKDTLKKLGFRIRDQDKIVSMKQEKEELKSHQKKMIFSSIGVGIASFLMILSWLGMTHIWFPIILTLTTMGMIFGVGKDILMMAVFSLRRGILNQHVLMEFGAIGGFIGGIVGFFISPWPMMDYFAAAIFITAYHLLSGYVAALVRIKSSSAVMKLLELQPPVARVIQEDGSEIEKPIEEVKKDNIVIVKPGESIPVDGIIIRGSSHVNQSFVTGEPLPLFKEVNDEVIGGSINLDGVIFIKTTKIGDESFLTQVSKSMQQARALKPGMLLLVEKVLQYFVPGVLLAALLAFIIWTVISWLIMGEVNFYKAIFSSLSVLVMGYPCALGMATPLAMIRGSGEAAQHGILIRSGEIFQAFKDVNTVVLDKTGTITKGKPVVTKIIPVSNNLDENDILLIAAALEQFSEHPLARAITKLATQRGLNYTNMHVEKFKVIPGKGITAKLESDQYIIGSPRLLLQLGGHLDAHDRKLRKLEKQGHTVIVLAKEHQLLGFIAFSDEIKEEAREIISILQDKLRMEVILVTGDTKKAARVIAKKVGIHRWYAEVLPQEKAKIIRRLQDEGHRVLMVGDGINDAPALTQANVGMAMASGTDIAMESADIILVNNHLRSILKARTITIKSYRKTKQNIAIAFSFNGIGIPLAMLGFLTPFHAMIAMILSVTAVLLNSYIGMLIPTAKSTSPLQSENHLTKKDRTQASRIYRAIMHVPTIHCSNCINNIKSVLMRKKGIITVTGSETDKSITIWLYDGIIELPTITKLLHKCGHEVENITLETK